MICEKNPMAVGPDLEKARKRKGAARPGLAKNMKISGCS